MMPFPEYGVKMPGPLASNHLHLQSKQQEVLWNEPVDEVFRAPHEVSDQFAYSNEKDANAWKQLPLVSIVIFQCQARHIPVARLSTYFDSSYIQLIIHA
jgi:hypothetical protein